MPPLLIFHGRQVPVPRPWMAASRVPLQLVRFASSTTTVKYLFARPSSSTTCVRLPAPKSASTTTFAMYIYTKTGPTSTARTFVPLPSPWIRRVPLQQVYLYLVFGIAKNVKYPFEMMRSASSNDPKYLFETTEYHYHRTLERLLPTTTVARTSTSIYTASNSNCPETHASKV